MSKIGVIAAGAWGTAIAHTLASIGHDVLIWSQEGDVVKSINKKHENARYLPAIELNKNLEATAKLDKLAKKCDTIFVCCPAGANTEVAVSIGHLLKSEQTLVLCSKGIRESDGALLSDVWQELVPQVNNVAVLAGPTFAQELADGKKTAFVVSSEKPSVMKQVGDLFNVNNIRVYYNPDIIGVQVSSALKGVIAIATGMSDALNMGNNMRAALISRGMAEISRYAQTLGGDPRTMAGLAGVGDILLSATSKLSRNYRFGKLIAQGTDLNEALAQVNGHVEGFHTARIVTNAATSRGVDLGIITAIDGILHGDITMEKSMDMLFDRPNTWEFEGPRT